MRHYKLEKNPKYIRMIDALRKKSRTNRLNKFKEELRIEDRNKIDIPLEDEIKK